jgi:hypothetical protein
MFSCGWTNNGAWIAGLGQLGWRQDGPQDQGAEWRFRMARNTHRDLSDESAPVR